MEKIKLYDTTLRDGMQAEGVSFSLEDKLLIVKKLDDFGMDYIEGGFPASNPKEEQFFEEACKFKLNNSCITAFGSTRRAKNTVEDDFCIQSLAKCGAGAVTLVGKSWPLHVEDVLKCSLDENLTMCAESVKYLIGKGKEVLFDAEHFFDGYKADADYAMRVLEAAAEAGAGTIVLCETNGGCLPDEVYQITAAVCSRLSGVKIGIHTHNDTDCAVANSLSAVLAGASHVQGTVNGIGERTGNANLCTIIPNLVFKMSVDVLSSDKKRAFAALNRSFGLLTGSKRELQIALKKSFEVLGDSSGITSAVRHGLSTLGSDTSKLYEQLYKNYEQIFADKEKLASAVKGFKVISREKLKGLTDLSRFVYEIANMSAVSSMPYVGESAFAHKGGLHIDALKKNELTYEHVNPEAVGNKRKFLLSELSGSSNVISRLEKEHLENDKDFARQLLDKIQNLENEGYQFEAAEASFDILIKKEQGSFKPSFELEKYHVSMERSNQGRIVTEATVKLMVDGKTEHVVSEGDGPVNALDKALRRSLEGFFPNLKNMHLVDYKVRVVNARAGTAAKVRVIIESRDKDGLFGTIGVSENLIEASWQALVDSIEYKLIKDSCEK